MTSCNGNGNTFRSHQWGGELVLNMSKRIPYFYWILNFIFMVSLTWEICFWFQASCGVGWVYGWLGARCIGKSATGPSVTVYKTYPSSSCYHTIIELAHFQHLVKLILFRFMLTKFKTRPTMPKIDSYTGFMITRICGEVHLLQLC